VRRTRPSSLIGFGVLGRVFGFLVEVAAASGGVAVFIPPLTLPITLVAVAIGIVAFALPIRRSVRGSRSRRVDPFQATRIVLLAKACGLSGAVLTGAGAGILVFLFTREVLPGGAAVLLTVLGTAGAVIFLVAGLLAEYFCTLPPGESEKEPADAPTR
jgi:hypothetical protein